MSAWAVRRRSAAPAGSIRSTHRRHASRCCAGVRVAANGNTFASTARAVVVSSVAVAYANVEAFAHDTAPDATAAAVADNRRANASATNTNASAAPVPHRNAAASSPAANPLRVDPDHVTRATHRAGRRDLRGH